MFPRALCQEELLLTNLRVGSELSDNKHNRMTMSGCLSPLNLFLSFLFVSFSVLFLLADGAETGTVHDS